jgi:hypothetical protein
VKRIVLLLLFILTLIPPTGAQDRFLFLCANLGDERTCHSNNTCAWYISRCVARDRVACYKQCVAQPTFPVAYSCSDMCLHNPDLSASSPRAAPQSTTSNDFVTITRNVFIIAITVAIITAATVLLIRATTRGIQTVNFTSPAQPRQPSQFVSQLRPGEILVRDKASGQIGAIPESEFDPDKYERV